MKYRKKPVVIEAIKLTLDNINEIGKWIGKDCREAGFSEDFKSCFVGIETLEGTMYAQMGDYIIKGVKGEFYPCKPDIFEATYEEVEDD